MRYKLISVMIQWWRLCLWSVLIAQVCSWHLHHHHQTTIRQTRVCARGVDMDSAYYQTLHLSFPSHFSSCRLYGGREDKSIPQASATPPPSQFSAEKVQRKKHVNKYSTFASTTIDPLQVALERKQQEEAMKQKQGKTRGTSIPFHLIPDPAEDNEKKRLGGKNKPKQKSNSTRKETVQALDQPVSNEAKSKVISKAERAALVAKIDPTDPSTFGFTEIGHIIEAHGVKGEVKISLQHTDFASFRMTPGNVIFLKKPSRRSPHPVRIASSRVFGHTNEMIYLVKFHGVSGRLQASLLRKYVVYCKADERPPLAADEFLIKDIAGLHCYHYDASNGKEASTVTEITKFRQPFGVVEGVVPPSELCESAAMVSLMHPMLEIRLIGTKLRCLLPFVPSIVPVVDVEDGKVFIDAPHGLLDLTYAVEEKVVIRGLLPAYIDRLSALERRILETQVVLVHPEGGTIVPFW